MIEKVRITVSFRAFRNSIFPLAVFGIIGLMLAGCGLTKTQKEGISCFGRAANTIGKAGSEQFIEFRTDTIAMNKTRLSIEGKKLSTVTPDGKPADRAFYEEDINLDSGLDPDNIIIRINAVNLLSSYGELLVAFSEESYKEEFRESADKFAASIASFPNSPLSKDKADALGKLVRSVEGIWIEHKKKIVLQEVVPVVSPLIQKICDSLEKDFDIKKGGIIQNVYLVQDRLAAESIDGLKKDTTIISDRFLLVNGFALATDCQNKLCLSSNRVLSAIAAMRKADKELVDLMSNKHISINEIKSFYSATRDMVDSLKPFVKG